MISNNVTFWMNIKVGVLNNLKASLLHQTVIKLLSLNDINRLLYVTNFELFKIAKNRRQSINWKSVAKMAAETAQETFITQRPNGIYNHKTWCSQQVLGTDTLYKVCAVHAEGNSLFCILQLVLHTLTLYYSKVCCMFTVCCASACTVHTLYSTWIES